MESKKKDKNIKTVKIQNTLRVTSYKGFDIFIQYFTKGHIFQCILYRNGQFYQAYDIVTPEKGQKLHTKNDLISLGAIYLETSTTIADKIIEAELDEKLKKGGIKADA